MSHQDNSAAAVAEIPYIPPAERQTALKVDPNENDTLVVVGQRQKKRKRKDAKHEMSDLPVASDSMQQIAKPEVFDFESVPNILDEPTPVAVPSKKKRREKGANFSRCTHERVVTFHVFHSVDVRWSQGWWYPTWQFWGPTAKYERDEKWKSIAHVSVIRLERQGG